MSSLPEFIWAWNFIPEKQDDVIKGGWDDVEDRKSIEYIRADRVRVTGFEDAPQWMDIETAPTDGIVVMVLMPSSLGHGMFSDGVKKGYWMEDLEEWQVEGVGGNVSPQPTHWTPIPKPPT